MLIRADARLIPLKGGSVNCCVTSPPYWGLREYKDQNGEYLKNQIGLEKTPEEYVTTMVGVFREVWRVLKDDGTCFLNLGDTFATGTTAGRQNGLKTKDLIGIPWRVAFALQADGWYLRSDIIWSKLNPMPESVKDRPTRAHEYIFLLSKNPRYYYDADAIKEDGIRASYHDSIEARKSRARMDQKSAPTKIKAGIRPKKDKQRGHSRRHAGFNDRWNAMTKEEQCKVKRNKRSVWTVATKPYSGAHYAVFPSELIKPCILAGCPMGGIVLDPFVGSGTAIMVAQNLGRHGIGLDIGYQDLASTRLGGTLFKSVVNRKGIA